MDALLYGHNAQERIVAVQQAGDNLMRLYVRGEGGIRSEEIEFFPFFFLSDSSLLSGYSAKHWVKELAGTNVYRYLCAFSRWPDMWDALRFILDRYNMTTPKKAGTFTELPVIHLRPDPVTQFLIQSGRTLFKGMEFHELHRLQLDIETYTRKIPPKSQLGLEDRIIIITLSDNKGWDCVIDGRKKTEEEMLRELVEVVQEKDPDVVEGHNIVGFDIPYILRRCQLVGVELKIGRDGSPLKSNAEKKMFFEGGWQSASGGYEIPGRHIIDTLLLLRAYDNTKRDLESHGLKYAAQYFGFARPERVYIKGSQIWWHWDNEPAKLIEYALDDVHEVRQLSEILSPSIFYLTQMIPLDYGVLARTGSAAKIESLLVREYVREKHSIPSPQPGNQKTGGYTDIFYTGILGPIIYADVESLYPSIMVGETIAPETDELKVFPALLKQLTDMRLDSKKRMNKASDQTEKTRLDAMQSSYKILINSFYGYLGYARGLFNDFEKADTVTMRGQKILRTIMEEIRRNDGRVVEVDTDGIFFIPPETVKDEKDEKTFVRLIAQPLPKSIKLNIDGRYRKMLSYKKKNYALLGYDGTVTIKGSSLVSRSMEPFGRKYIEQCITLLLENKLNELHSLYIQTHHNVANRTLNILDLARAETLRDSQEHYEREVAMDKRNRAASYEAAISAGLQWRPGQKVSCYITGNDPDVTEFKNSKLVDQWDPNFPDENIPHYLRRLQEFSKKFEQFFLQQDYRAIFSLDDLFDFSTQGVGILVSQVPETPVPYYEEEAEQEEIDFPIWLDTEEKGKT